MSIVLLKLTANALTYDLKLPSLPGEATVLFYPVRERFSKGFLRTC